MGSTADAAVGAYLFGCELHLVVGKGVEPQLYLLERGCGEGLTADDVELAGTGASLGVDVVVFAGSRYDSTAVEDVGQAELRLYGVAEVAFAQLGARFSMAAK